LSDFNQLAALERFLWLHGSAFRSATKTMDLIQHSNPSRQLMVFYNNEQGSKATVESDCTGNVKLTLSARQYNVRGCGTFRQTHLDSLDIADTLPQIRGSVSTLVRRSSLCK
jgi:hypothetical protein